jgi:hypothetical protein
VPLDATELARRLGYPDPDEGLLTAVTEAIEDAESDVEAYLGRPIRPVELTATGRWPGWDGWDLPDDQPIRRIISTTPEAWPDGTLTGQFTVVYEVGLDYLNDDELRPIRRYVRAAAQNDPTLLAYLANTKGGHGAIKSMSVSTEGQSKNITYADVSYGGGGQAGADSPGALPSKKSMDRWRLAGRRIHQARGDYRPLWGSDRRYR